MASAIFFKFRLEGYYVQPARVVLLVLVSAALLVCGPRLDAQQRSSTDWPQWRGANRDGRVPALPRSVSEPRLVWKQPVAGTCDAGIAVVAGLLVAADHDAAKDYYRCLDADKGTQVWVRSFPNAREMDYGAGPRATPLVYHDKVYVLSAFGELYCFDLRTGKTVWQEDFLKDFAAGKEPKWGYSSSPLIAQNKLIVNPGGRAALAALDPDTGKVLWEGKGGNPNYSSFIAGSFGGVEQVVGHDDASLGGWDLATGKRLWSVPMEQGAGYIVPTPLNVAGKLLVTDNSNESQLFAFDSRGVIIQEPVAKNEDIAPEVITPVAVGDLVIGLSKRLVCLDAGKELGTLWTYSKETIFKRDCHLIISQDAGLAFSSHGELLLFTFDRQGATILGKAKLCGKTLMHPTLVGTRLYVRDGEFLYCYELAS
jgi:outer membrane protein assembly factor BamB